MSNKPESPKVADFVSALKKQISEARSEGKADYTITALELHEKVGGYPPPPGDDHRMPACCAAMRKVLKVNGGKILNAPKGGDSSTLKIEYHLDKNASVPE